MKNFSERLRAVQSIVTPELVGCPYCNPSPPSPRMEIILDRIRLLLQWYETPGQPELAMAIAHNYEQYAACELLHPANAKPVRAPCKRHAYIAHLVASMAESFKNEDHISGGPELPNDATGWRLLAAQCGQTRPNAATGD